VWVSTARPSIDSKEGFNEVDFDESVDLDNVLVPSKVKFRLKAVTLDWMTRQPPSTSSKRNRKRKRVFQLFIRFSGLRVSNQQQQQQQAMRRLRLLISFSLCLLLLVQPALSSEVTEDVRDEQQQLQRTTTTAAAAPPRGFEYLSSFALFPSQVFGNTTFNATITLPPQPPSSFSDTDQQLWFYTAFGPSNDSQVEHITIQSKLEFGRFGIDNNVPQWVIQCVFITSSEFLITNPIPISTPSVYVHSTGEYDPNTSMMTLFTQITAAEDPGQVASLSASFVYEQPQHTDFQFQSSVVMEAQNVLEDGCVSFPTAGIALYQTELAIGDERYDPTAWQEQDGEGSYSPRSPCNLTFSTISPNEFVITW